MIKTTRRLGNKKENAIKDWNRTIVDHTSDDID